jgi:hypothetical protein
MKITKATLKRLIKEELLNEADGIAKYDGNSEQGQEFEQELRALDLDPLFELLYEYEVTRDEPHSSVRGGGKLYTSSGYQTGEKMTINFLMEKVIELYRNYRRERS